MKKTKANKIILSLQNCFLSCLDVFNEFTISSAMAITSCTSYYNSSSVCMFVCSVSAPRSFDGSSPNLVAVCRWTSELPLRGSFSKRSTGQRVTFTFHYIIYAPASRHTAAKGPFCFAAAAESNSAPFAALYLNGVCRWCM